MNIYSDFTSPTTASSGSLAVLRLEGDIPPPVVSLAEKMSQQAEMIFPDIVVQRMHQLERELRQQQLSEESLNWLAIVNLTPEWLAEPPCQRMFIFIIVTI